MVKRLQELIEGKQYHTMRRELEEYNVADIASELEALPCEELVKIFRILPKSVAAEVFSYFPIEVEQEIIKSLTDNESAEIINNLFADDAADLLEEMPASVVTRLLAKTSPQTRSDINHLLNYPEDSAGSIMTVEFVDLKENITVEQAMDRIREVGLDKETINVCFVLDMNRKLCGTVTLRQLLLSEKTELVKNIIQDSVIAVNTLTDQEEVAQMFQKYDFTSMPVVDSEHRLVGIITVDDIVDIMEEEATKDIEMMAAITPTDKSYMKTSVFETWKKRIPWLLLLMISATFTGSIIQHFETALSKFVVLTSFIPMLMDTGGNAGGQASVTIIRGISLNEIQFKDIFKVVWKEIRVAVICALTLGAANFAKLMIFDKVTMQIAFVVCITLCITVVIAKTVGCTLPIVAKKIGFDPAVMASPFITTIVDAISLIVYFQVAGFLLHI